MELLNLYDHYRMTSLDSLEPVQDDLPPVHGLATQREACPDGSPFRTTYLHPGSGKPTIFDFHRPDGSVFARTTPTGAKAFGGGPRARLINRSGQVVRTFGTVSALYRYWMRELCPGDESVFAFVDSRNLMPQLLPAPAPRFHMLYVLHNVHVSMPRRWDSPMPPVYRNVLKNIPRLDAFVTLTRRQRDDVAERSGDTSNLFVVPNPVRIPEKPLPIPRRDPHRLAVWLGWRGRRDWATLSGALHWSGRRYQEYVWTSTDVARKSSGWKHS